MPNKPKPSNPSRPVRVEDTLWNTARGLLRDGETMSDLTRAALAREVHRRSRLKG